MKKELQEQLFAIEPSWFNRTNMKNSLMCFGFEVGDGWFPLLQKLLHDLKPLVGPDFKVFQVKEKWGGLCFYADNLPESCDNLIYEAEKKSTEICDGCGNPGKVRGKHWVRTVCDKCEER